MSGEPLKKGDRIEAVNPILISYMAGKDVEPGTRGVVTSVMPESGLVDVVWDNGEIDVVGEDDVRALSAIERLGDLAE